MAYYYSKNNIHVYQNRMGFYKTERQLAFIEEMLPEKKLRILDIGGGDGRLTFPLAEKGHLLSVLDISEEALNSIARESNSNIECIHSELMRFKSDKLYDVALAIDCVKYMCDSSLREVFVKVNELLVDGGIFIFSDMNTHSWRYQLRLLLGRDVTVKYNIASLDEYMAALKDSCLTPLSVHGYCWMPFAFNSNSPLVPLFKCLEDIVHLSAWTSQSPWFLIAAKKAESSAASSSFSK